jgi:hypothetical protein
MPGPFLSFAPLFTGVPRKWNSAKFAFTEF